MPHPRTPTIRSRAFATTALTAGILVAGWPWGEALAQCAPDPGVNVVCAGIDPDGYADNTDKTVTVDVNANAEVQDPISVTASTNGLVYEQFGPSTVEGGIELETTGTITIATEAGTVIDGTGKTSSNDAIHVETDVSADLTLNGTFKAGLAGGVAAIQVVNETAGQSPDVTINLQSGTARIQTAGQLGILVVTPGEGDIDIDIGDETVGAAASVLGSSNGIQVTAADPAATGKIEIEVTDFGNVQSTGAHAILVQMFGTGPVTVENNGAVNGFIDGIRVVSAGLAAGEQITVANYALGTINAGDHAVFVTSDEATPVTVINAGMMNAVDEAVSVSTQGGDIVVDGKDGVYGSAKSDTSDGIFLQTIGSGTITVDAGTITAADNGIDANAENGLVLVDTRGRIEAALHGVAAETSGTGDVTVRVHEGIEAGTGALFESGVLAEAFGTGNVSVTLDDGKAIDATGLGINAFTALGGAVDVVADGDIGTGTEPLYHGIAAWAFVGGDVEVTTSGFVTAGQSAVFMAADGAGTVRLTNSGTLVGDGGTAVSIFGGGTVATVFSRSVDGTTIVNEATGLIRGDDTLPDELIIDVDGGAATIDNFGTMIGRLDLTDENDLFRNWSETTWTTSGVTDFGAGFDQLANPGRIEIVDAAEFADLELFLNFDTVVPADTGIIDMADGDPDEQLTTSGDYDGGDGSLLQIDAVLDFFAGPDEADLFVIEDEAFGMTLVEVFNLNPGAGSYDPEGILVVDVSDGVGNAVADNFRLLDGPIDVGFFDYDIYFDDDADQNEFWLRNALNERGHEPPRLVTGAQELFHASSQTWLDRTADLRIFTDPGVGTMSAAENRAESGYTDGAPGGWLRGYGAWFERDTSDTLQTGRGSVSAETGYDQSIFGVQAGVDLPLTRPNNPGGTFIIGALAGYAWSEQEFDATPSTADLDGPEIGLYATYLSGGFFADLLVKAQFLELDYETGFGSADDSDSADVTSYGAVLDAGYRFDFDAGFFVEPQATLAYAVTDVDDMELLATEVSFDDGDSLRGRLGVRAGARFQPTSATVIEPFLGASLWNEFSGDNEATLSGPGGSLTVSDDASEVWGEVTAGVNVVDFGSGVSGFVQGDYRFGDELDGVAVQAGLRVNF